MSNIKPILQIGSIILGSAITVSGIIVFTINRHRSIKQNMIASELNIAFNKVSAKINTYLSLGNWSVVSPDAMYDEDYTNLQKLSDEIDSRFMECFYFTKPTVKDVFILDTDLKDTISKGLLLKSQLEELLSFESFNQIGEIADGTSLIPINELVKLIQYVLNITEE